MKTSVLNYATSYFKGCPKGYLVCVLIWLDICHSPESSVSIQLNSLYFVGKVKKIVNKSSEI